MEAGLVVSMGLNIILLWVCHKLMKEWEGMVDNCLDLIVEVSRLRMKLSKEETASKSK